MSVTFSKECAQAVVNHMIGENFTEMNAEVADAVGELTNMISGDARWACHEQTPLRIY